MTRDEIKALVETLAARKAEIDAMPLVAGGLLGKRASQEAMDAYDAEVHPGMMKLYDECKARGMIEEFNTDAIIKSAAIIAAGGYWVEGTFSPDDDMVFFPVGLGIAPMTQAEAAKVGFRKWVEVQ